MSCLRLNVLAPTNPPFLLAEFHRDHKFEANLTTLRYVDITGIKTVVSVCKKLVALSHKIFLTIYLSICHLYIYGEQIIVCVSSTC